jgi:hypothetical protein
MKKRVRLLLQFALIILPITVGTLCAIYYAVDLVWAGLPMTTEDWHQLSRDKASCMKIKYIQQRETIYNLLGWDSIFYITMRDNSFPRFVRLTPKEFRDETYILWKKKGV